MVIGRSNGLASPETGLCLSGAAPTNAPTAVTSCISPTKCKTCAFTQTPGASLLELWPEISLRLQAAVDAPARAFCRRDRYWAKCAGSRSLEVQSLAATIRYRPIL
jgi:hypothetical protein